MFKMKKILSLALAVGMIVSMNSVTYASESKIIHPNFGEDGPLISGYTIYDSDDRTNVTNGNIYPYKAVAHLQVKYPGNITRYGTGFMYGDGAMATAGHTVLDSRYGQAQSINAYFGRTGTYTYYTSHTINASNMHIPDEWTGEFTTANMKHDYGVLTVPSSVSSATGWFGLNPNASSGMEVNILGHGVYNNSIEYRQKKATGNLTGITSTMLQYQLDTLPGNSGAPVFDDEYYVYGINTYGDYDGNFIENPSSDNCNFATRIATDSFNFLRSFL